MAYDNVKEVDCLDVSKEGTEAWDAACKRYLANSVFCCRRLLMLCWIFGLSLQDKKGKRTSVKCRQSWQ